MLTPELINIMNRLAQRRAAMLDGFIARYMVDTGLSIDRIRLVEQRTGNMIQWHCEASPQVALSIADHDKEA